MLNDTSTTKQGETMTAPECIALDIISALAKEDIVNRSIIFSDEGKFEIMVEVMAETIRTSLQHLLLKDELARIIGLELYPSKPMTPLELIRFAEAYQRGKALDASNDVFLFGDRVKVLVRGRAGQTGTVIDRYEAVPDDQGEMMPAQYVVWFGTAFDHASEWEAYDAVDLQRVSPNAAESSTAG